MKTISKKCQPPYFEQILSGAKRFEIRLNFIDLKDIVSIDCCMVEKSACRLFLNHQECCATCEKNTGLKDITKYAVGDTLELREWVDKEHHKSRSIGYTGRAVACRITSLVNLFIRDYPLNDNVGLNSAGPPTVMIDGKEFWSGEDILQYGLVVIGISIIGEK